MPLIFPLFIRPNVRQFVLDYEREQVCERLCHLFGNLATKGFTTRRWRYDLTRAEIVWLRTQLLEHCTLLQRSNAPIAEISAQFGRANAQINWLSRYALLCFLGFDLREEAERRINAALDAGFRIPLSAAN